MTLYHSFPGERGKEKKGTGGISASLAARRLHICVALHVSRPNVNRSIGPMCSWLSGGRCTYFQQNLTQHKTRAGLSTAENHKQAWSAIDLTSKLKKTGWSGGVSMKRRSEKCNRESLWTSLLRDHRQSPRWLAAGFQPTHNHFATGVSLYIEVFFDICRIVCLQVPMEGKLQTLTTSASIVASWSTTAMEGSGMSTVWIKNSCESTVWPM